eukprot:GFUD01016759.1.p1 GENE.GFUD01016759.1~~GFUD01016759.1.p1  ORF type:complete len:225 (-),score=68.34 GFUD01016759.1:127-801(-)
MSEDEAFTAVTNTGESNVDILDTKGHSETTTTTTVLTKTWLLGFPSVKDDVQIKEYEENKDIRQKFDDLTKTTDELLRELQNIKVANCVESSKEQTVYATNTRIPYKYSREILVSPTNHQETFLTDFEYPRVTYTRKNINSNPFIDSADSMTGENCQPDPPSPGCPGFLSPQLARKTYPEQTNTLPAGGRARQIRTRKLSEELIFACDESTQTQSKARKRCLVM